MLDSPLNILRTLIRQGYAGVDQYDDNRFVIDAPEPFRTQGEDACDEVGASFVKTAPPGVRSAQVVCILPSRVYMALGLDEPDAPRLMVPLASRRVEA